MSVEVPERIWVYKPDSPEDFDGCAEYVRADKLEELQVRVTELAAEVECVRGGNRYAHLERIAIKRAEKAEAALAEAKRENEALREALKLAEFMLTKDSLCQSERLEEGLTVIRRARNAGGKNAE